MPYASGRAFRALGEGLTGIGRTVGALRREEEELERRNLEDQRRREYEDLQTELGFIDRGGGLGPAPEMERMVPGTRPELDFDAPELFPEPAPNGGVGLGTGAADRAGLLAAPDLLPEPEPLTLSEPDPRYASVGPGYVERPGVAEDRARLERGSRIEGGVTDLLGDRADPGTARGIGRLTAEGVNPASFMPQAAPEVNWQTVTDAQGNVHQLHPRTGETRPTGITERVPGPGGTRRDFMDDYRNAVATLKDMFPHPEFANSSSLSAPEMDRMARAMARGEELFPEPSLGAPDEGAMAGYPKASIDRVMRNYRMKTGAGLPEPAIESPGIEEPTPNAPGPRSTVEQPDTAAARARAATLGATAEELRAAGASEDEIRLLLGGR